MDRANKTTYVITRELLDTYPIPPDLSPSEFIKIYWGYYQKNYKSNNSVNGTVFENLIIISLAREGIKNIYYQTQLSFVPSAKFDVFLYHEETPMALSIKTSLRERWKQADLEAAALKQVHKEAESYVITLDRVAVNTRRRLDRTYAGLNGFIIADNVEYDKFVYYLKTKQYVQSGAVPIIKTADNYYTADSLKHDFHFRT